MKIIFSPFMQLLYNIAISVFYSIVCTDINTFAHISILSLTLLLPMLYDYIYRFSLTTPQPFIQHRAHGFHDLPHHVRIREHLYKEVLILLIAGGGHVGEVLLKQ